MIKHYDEEYKKRQQGNKLNLKEKNESEKVKKKKTDAGNNKFNEFSQRSYDFDNLEKKLMM